MWRRIRALIFMGLVMVGCARKPTEPNLSNAASHVPAEDVDTWLARREAHFTDITPGAEKTIMRVSEEKTPISIVFVHGFGATRQELSPMVETVAEELGANAHYTRLTGHGRPGEYMTEGSVEAWMADIAEAMEVGRRLGDRVVLISSSTGSTLSAWLASKSPPDLAALVYFSPNFGLRDKRSRMLLWPGRRILLRLIIGKERSWEPANEGIARYWSHRYPAPAIFPMMELVNHVQDTDLSQVRQPALVVYSSGDTVTDPAETVARFAEMGATPKKLHEVKDDGDPNHHILAGDCFSPQTTEPLSGVVVDFLREALSL